MRRAGTIGAAVLALWTAGAGAQEMTVSGGVQLRGSAQYLALSHDASGASPMLGDPTSVLEYQPLASVGAALAVSGRSEALDGAWFDLIAGVPLASAGTFRDTDYLAGQAMFSDTLSDAALGWQADFSARVAMPGVAGFSADAWVARPYLVASGMIGEWSVRGLRCGTICGALPVLPDTTEVIGHRVTGLAGGAGVWLEQRLTGSERIDWRIEALAGYLGVMDSHHFRPDLGPAPNIAYHFGTVSARTELVLTHELGNGGEISAGVFGAAGVGLGSAAFGASMTPTLGSFPARMVTVSGGVAVSAAVPF